MTTVKFYKEKDGQILAYFPEMACGYAHIGQHCAVDKPYLKGLKLATYDEYKDLLDELIGQGYDDLIVSNLDKSKTVRSWSPLVLLLSVILGSILLASCNTYKRSAGCGSYESWESNTKYRNPR